MYVFLLNFIVNVILSLRIDMDKMNMTTHVHVRCYRLRSLLSGVKEIIIVCFKELHLEVA